ncbi:MAG: anti-sigma factor [Parvibaculaceae bacterium]
MTAQDRDIQELADEYVLGLLDADETARVEARIEHDAALRAAVGASRDRFLEIDLAAEPAGTSPQLWARIAARLGDPVANSGAISPVSSAIAPANDNFLTLWRRVALVAMAASVVLALGLGWSLLSPQKPRVIAILVNDAGSPLVVVEDFGDASARITPLVDFEVPEGRIMQVWTLPSPELGPVSLGLMQRAETVTIEGPKLPEPHPEQLYEITLEQTGGSPTGRPTGPILVKGFAKVPR